MANMGFVCSLLVVIVHLRPPCEVGSVAWVVFQVLRYGFGTIAVPYFFVASGYFIARRSGEPGWWCRAVRKRIRTLLVPYLFWCAVMWAMIQVLYPMLLNALTGRCLTDGTSLAAEWWMLGVALTKRPISGAMWYVRALIFFVLISPVLLAVVSRIKGWLVLVLFTVYYFVCPGHPDGSGIGVVGDAYEFFRFVLPLEGLCFFSLGLLLGRVECHVSGKFAAPALLVGVLLGLIRVCFLAAKGAVPIPLVPLLIPFVMFGVWHFMPERKWPTWLVSSSFAIYCIHPFLVQFFDGLLDRVIGPVACEGLAYMLGCFVFASGGAIGLTLLIRRFLPRLAGLIFGGR